MTTSDRSGEVLWVLRQWLRNERLLGIQHWPVCDVACGKHGSASPSVHPRERSRFAQVGHIAGPAHGSADGHRGQPVASLIAPGGSRGGLFADDPSLPPLCQVELPPSVAAEALAQLDTAFVRNCTRCRLHQHRTQTVFGVGNPRPSLVFVGEGPGAEEDAQGEPFVGRAGQLLTRMIAAMTLTREQVYICNVVKCRPPGNRTPSEDEMETCSPFLLRQLAILRPRVIVALGRPATQTLLATQAPITKLRGQVFDFPTPAHGLLGLPPAKLVPTFHPAYLLRNPAAKGDAWADLQQVMKLLGLSRAAKRQS